MGANSLAIEHEKGHHLGRQENTNTFLGALYNVVLGDFILCWSLDRKVSRSLVGGLESYLTMLNTRGTTSMLN